MLLALDIGNTNTVLGLFKDGALVHDWRIRTEVNMTIDEYAITLRSLFAVHGIPLDRVSGRDHIVRCAACFELRRAVLPEIFRTTALVVGSGNQNRHADPLRQSEGGGRGQDRKCRGGL